MTADIRSLWLMPSAADEAFLSALLHDLAGRFGAPVFTPHLTLRGDTAEPAGKLSQACAVAARQVPAFPEPIVAVETTPAFFRAFYARFLVSGPLAALKRSLDPDGLNEFVPHVSLLYGEIDEAAKAPAAAEFGRRLAGRAIVFDRICVVRSGQDIAIADWAILETVPLARA